MGAAATLQPVLTDADIAARIDAYVARNVSPLKAAERVLADLCREGLAEALLDRYGPPMLFEVWEDAKPKPQLSEDGLAAIREAHPRAIARKMELAALRKAGSIVESLVEVDGRWHRLGDLNRKACLRLAAQNKRKALSVAASARFYHLVAQQLADGQTVREKLDDAALARLREEAGQ